MILLSAIVLVLVVFEGYMVFRSDALRFKNDYEFASFLRPDNSNVEVNIPSKNLVTYVDDEQLLEVLEKKTGIVYLGYANCPWCQNIVGPLVEISNEYQLPIYYFNSKKKYRSKTFIHDFIDRYGSYLRSVDGKKRISFPDVYFVKEGTIIGHHIGTVPTQKNPYKKLTKEEKNLLLEIYRQYIVQMEEKE